MAATGSSKDRRIPTLWQALRRQFALSRRAHVSALPTGIVTALLVAIVRAAPAVAAIALVRFGPRSAIEITVGVLAVSVVRGLIEQAAMQRFQAGFTRDLAQEIATRCALTAPSPDSIQSTCFIGIRSAATIATRTLPALAGELVVAICLLPVVVTALPAGLLLLAIPGVAAAIGVAWVLRRASARAMEVSWDRANQFVAEFSTLLHGSLELIAAGRAAKAAAAVARSARDWTVAGVRSERLAAAGGRAPLAVVAGVVTVLAWGWVTDHPDLWREIVARGLLIGTLLALAQSLSRGVIDIDRAAREVLALLGVIGSAPDPVSPASPVEFDVSGRIEFDAVTFRYDSSDAGVAAVSVQIGTIRPAHGVQLARPSWG